MNEELRQDLIQRNSLAQACVDPALFPGNYDNYSLYFDRMAFLMNYFFIHLKPILLFLFSFFNYRITPRG